MPMNKTLPTYEPDNGQLTSDQIRQMKNIFPQGTRRSVKSSLLGSKKIDERAETLSTDKVKAT